MRGAVVVWVYMTVLYVMNDDFGRSGRFISVICLAFEHCNNIVPQRYGAGPRSICLIIVIP